MVLLPLVVYVSVCAYLFLAQQRLLYHPTPEVLAPQAERFWLPKAETRINVWQANPGQTQAVLYLGGNAESVENMLAPLSHALPKHSIYSMNYRGYGWSDGEASEAALYADALLLMDYLLARHAAVRVIGRSLGSGVATYLATQRRFEHLVLVTPFDSVESLAQSRYPWAPIAWLLRDKYRSIDRVGALTQKSLILTASDDAVVPRDHSQRLFAAFSKARTQHIEIPHTDHSNIVQKAPFTQALQTFFAAP